MTDELSVKIAGRAGGGGPNVGWTGPPPQPPWTVVRDNETRAWPLTQSPGALPVWMRMPVLLLSPRRLASATVTFRTDDLDAGQPPEGAAAHGDRGGRAHVERRARASEPTGPGPERADVLQVHEPGRVLEVQPERRLLEVDAEVDHREGLVGRQVRHHDVVGDGRRAFPDQREALSSREAVVMVCAAANDDDVARRCGGDRGWEIGEVRARSAVLVDDPSRLSGERATDRGRNTGGM